MKQNTIAKTLFCGCGVFFLIMVSSVHGGKILSCLLSTVVKLPGVFCPGWQKIWCLFHPGKNSLVSFGSSVFCRTFFLLTKMNTSPISEAMEPQRKLIFE